MAIALHRGITGATKEDDMNTTMKLWYEGKTGNHQALVIEEGTGRTVAVTYGKTEAARIVRAVNSFDAMREALEGLVAVYREGDGLKYPGSKLYSVLIQAKAALALAKGEQ